MLLQETIGHGSLEEAEQRGGGTRPADQAVQDKKSDQGGDADGPLLRVHLSILNRR